ncbi:MAG: hypothetical protein K2W82_04875 [Candidatus Obscuribacterales bacterium]|nr:hypothetical protein [Candidatus Obscuribacterales bacterium]
MTFLSNFAFTLVIGLAAYSQASAPDDYTKAVEAYKAGNYGRACQLLEPLVKRNPNVSQSTWLLLGHCYGRVGQTKAAKIAYQWTYNLNPNNNAGKQALSLLGSHKGSLENAGIESAGKNESADLENKSDSDFQKRYDLIVQKMPKLRPYEPEKPTMVELLTLSNQEKLNSWDHITGRKAAAADALEQYSRTIQQARMVALTLVPNSKSYGETDGSFSKRQAFAKLKADELVKPYEERLKQLERDLFDASTLYDSCFNIPIRRY